MNCFGSLSLSLLQDHNNKLVIKCLHDKKVNASNDINLLNLSKDLFSFVDLNPVAVIIFI